MPASPRRVLISLSDKQGLIPFAQGLVRLGFELLSTGGTRKSLEAAGVPVLDVAQYTGFPEMMDGRVKTLHPKVHGGLLGRPDLAEDAKSMADHGITPFELVVVNLYPFVETISKAAVTPEEAIEQIDIGGPSMLRSAAKNHKYVGVVTTPAQYGRVLQELEQGALSFAFRRELAAAAFEMTARYDRAIADYLAGLTTDAASPASSSDDKDFPPQLSLNYQRRSSLRYGENPHPARSRCRHANCARIFASRCGGDQAQQPLRLCRGDHPVGSLRQGRCRGPGQCIWLDSRLQSRSR